MIDQDAKGQKEKYQTEIQPQFQLAYTAEGTEREEGESGEG